MLLCSRSFASSVRCFSSSTRGGGGGGGRPELSLSLHRKIEVLAKNRGFAWPSSDVYGGMSGSFDFGPLGASMKDNIKRLWWRDFVDKKPENIRMDSATILNEGVWRASGHADKFRDVVSACKSCNVRSRVDHIPGWTDANARADVACPACGKKGVLGEPSEMNLLFPTRYGTAHDTFLRPETAQGIFINYPHLTKLVRSRFPFGVGQMGKAFRNELNVEHFLFRTREFEMMELEYFCAPHEADFATKYWTEFTFDWLKGIGLNEHKMRLVKHAQGEGAHYALETFDIEYEYPHGWAELCGVANRGDYDLSLHAEHGNAKPSAFQQIDPLTGERYFPYIVEPSIGLDRLMYALMCDGYDEETLDNGETRTRLNLHMDVAPVVVAVLPLSKKQPLLDLSRRIHLDLLDREVRVDLDEQGSIGKRYRRQDEIGTHYALTVDFESLEDNCVTVRDGFTRSQVRVDIETVIERMSTPRHGMF